MEAEALLLQLLAFGHNFIILTRRQIFNFIFLCSTVSMLYAFIAQIRKACASHMRDRAQKKRHSFNNKSLNRSSKLVSSYGHARKYLRLCLLLFNIRHAFLNVIKIYMPTQICINSIKKKKF